MKLLVQWSLASPRDWQEIDHTDWPSLPKRPAPKGGERIDNKPGWIYDLACQGVWMGGVDHIAVEPFLDGVRVTGWNDDPDDYPAGTRWARVMTFLPDGSQTKDYYAEPDADVRALGPHVHSGPNGKPHAVRFLPWGEFVPPADPAHGIWLPDELNRRHTEVRRVPSYREWF